MVKLSAEIISSTKSDDELFRLIGEELDRRLPNGRRASDDFVSELQNLPIGLRSMAATYELDVSLALDDLGCHFGNWHHKGLAVETEKGLVELGAQRLSELFRDAFWHAQRFWDELGSDNLSDWYHDSEFERAVMPLNEEAWSILKESDSSLLMYWLKYAREHPDNLS